MILCMRCGWDLLSFLPSQHSANYNTYCTRPASAQASITNMPWLIKYSNAGTYRNKWLLPQCERKWACWEIILWVCWVEVISGLICMMVLCITTWVNTDCYAYIPKCRTVAATIMFRYSSILPPKMQSGEPKWCWHTDKPGNWCLALLDIKVYSCLYNIWLSYNIILSCVFFGLVNLYMYKVFKSIIFVIYWQA